MKTFICPCKKSTIQKATENLVSFDNIWVIVTPKGSFFACNACGVKFDGVRFAKCEFKFKKNCKVERLKK